MSSFNNPHHLYLFEMKNGKKKLAYGATPEDAYASLRLRLTEQEMQEIDPTRFVRIPQRDLQKYARDLG